MRSKISLRGWPGAVIIVLASAGMIFFLLGYSDSIHALVLEREMQKVGQTAHYITKTVVNEFDRCVDTLKVIEELVPSDTEGYLEAYSEHLGEIVEQSGFLTVGIMDLEGNGTDSAKNSAVPSNPDLYAAIRENKTYISDILMDGSRETGRILIAVPLYQNRKTVGAVWGEYPISVIAGKVEEGGQAEQFFQIVDNEGRYISRSASQYAFAKKLPLWEELERYEFPNGETVEEIRESVNKRESGQFYFQYDGEGRYVAYEPLGINNWYVFSVLLGDPLDEYAEDIKKHLELLTAGFSAFLLVIFAVISRSVYEGRRVIENQNRELATKGRLLWMILAQTQDIPFEISVADRTMKLYHTYCDTEKDFEVLTDFSGDALLANGWIKPEAYEAYQKLYEDVISGRKTEPLVLETNFDKKWGWKKLHIIDVGKDPVIGFMENYTDQEKKEKQLQETKKKTQMDVLTGLYNRSAFAEMVEDALKERDTLKKDGISALFLLDLDHFKEINDTLGHLMGDQVLCDSAKRMKASVRSIDFAGRLGGDEFVLFIQDAVELSDIHACAKKLNSVLSAEYEKDGQKVSVSASIGIALVKEETAFSRLYEKADAALYEVKRNGKNGYKIGEYV